MRKGETAQIRETFSYMESLRVIEARDRFLEALSGVTDPEEKRKIIGEQFIREFEREAKDADADYLVQGRSTPTGSRARAGSSPTTTSAASPKSSTSRASSNRSATSTRTRFARSPVTSDSRRSSQNECRSPVLVLPYASSAK